MTSPKKIRKTYSIEFKEEALKLAAKVGVAQAARELNRSPTETQTELILIVLV